jgi:hydrogenase/urease accessory protein HupE
MKLLALVLLIAPSLLAHEIATTRVHGTFHGDGTYRIDITLDPETLLDRLTLLANGPRTPPPADPAELQRRIERHRALLLRQVAVLFDGARHTPSVQYVPLVNEPSKRTALIRLEGPIPTDARTFRWSYALPYSPYLLTLEDEIVPGASREWIDGDATSTSFPLGKRTVEPTRAQTALLYLHLGFTHIIPRGLDHILFVLGIFLLSTKWRPLLAQVTAFTIAHSVTLALSLYQVMSLPSRIVEPAIALSIAYVGFENVMARTMKPWRIALVFSFGLLHGMGFAGVLTDLAIPRSEFVTALVAFNAGVELGQLTVIGIAFVMIASWARRKTWHRARIVVPASILIGLTGVFWTIQRSLW